MSTWVRENQKERRYSQRWCCQKSICYRERGQEQIFQARLCERSLNGMVIVCSPDACAKSGAYLVPADDPNAMRHGFRLGLVRRTGPPEKNKQLMYVEIFA